MRQQPNAFDPPVWYVILHAALPGLLTRERYAQIIAAHLNRHQRNALILVEEHTFIPDAVYLMVRERAMALHMWLPAFASATAATLYRRLCLDNLAAAALLEEQGKKKNSHPHELFWSSLQHEAVTSFETYDSRCNDMLYIPVRRGYATDPQWYAFNSINNKAGILVL